mgnify:CR=1 FL=1
MSRQRKKILYIESNVDGTVGGSYFSLLFLIQGLDKKKYAPVVLFYRQNELMDKYREAGCEVVVFCPPRPVNILRFLKTKNSQNSFLTSFLSFPVSIFQKSLNYLLLLVFPAFQCRRILKKEDIDLIHLNNSLLRPQEWILASYFTKAYIVAHERGINVKYPFHNRLLARKLKAVFCISNAVKDKLLMNGFPSTQLHLIYNGIDPEQFVITRSKQTVLDEFGLNREDHICGVVGNIKRWKGQEVAIKAMEIVSYEYPEAKCLLIGGCSENDKDYYDHLQKLVVAKGLQKNIIFTGYRRDIPNLMNILDIVVHTSLLPEPFGRILLEGMALSKPVVTPNIGAGPEVVVDHETGIIFKTENAQDLASRLIYLFENQKIAEKMGKAGFQRLLKHFHIRENVKQTQLIYSTIFNN